MSEGNDSASKVLEQQSAKYGGLGTEADPLFQPQSDVVRNGDDALLIFAEGRQVFVHCVEGTDPDSSFRVSRKTYSTRVLVGLPYGTVLELRSPGGLVPLGDEEDLLPEPPKITMMDGTGDGETGVDNIEKQTNDNRHLVDDNTSQTIGQKQLTSLVQAGTGGAEIVETLIANSKSFQSKTEFSKAKYIAKKQKKYQLRCRLVRCTPYTICQALYLKDPKRMMNMRDDTLGQILSYSNISAGSQVLVMETCMGVVTGAIASRMGGYGKIFSLYSGHQPRFTDTIAKFNLSFGELATIKWLHTGDVFGIDHATTTTNSSNQVVEEDLEREDREALQWPCPLQPHTRQYMKEMPTAADHKSFLVKRCARFARKLTRQTPIETKDTFYASPCDSIVIVARYEVTATLMGLLPNLAPSGPFVVFCEHLEPLARCFRELQEKDMAVNLRLSDTWTREFQVLPGRTHPNMTMSQGGGYLLHGVKLSPTHGKQKMDEATLKDVRESMSSRRKKARQSAKKRKQPLQHQGDDDTGENKKVRI